MIGPSAFEPRRLVILPPNEGVRVMMMPVRIGNAVDVAHLGRAWRHVFEHLSLEAREHAGEVGYLTIDQKLVRAGETHRNPGKHVDGAWDRESGHWRGYGGGGGYGAGGMLVVADKAGCRAWRGSYEYDLVGNDGECEHIPTGGMIEEEMQADRIYWCGAYCIHESLPMPVDTERTFVRLSLPSNGAWYTEYTASPTGVQPTGPIKSGRRGWA